MSECQRYFYLEYFKFESLSAILILQTKVYISTSTNVDRMLEEATSWPFYRIIFKALTVHWVPQAGLCRGSTGWRSDSARNWTEIKKLAARNIFVALEKTSENDFLSERGICVSES